MAIVLTVNDKHFERKLGADESLKMAGTASNTLRMQLLRIVCIVTVSQRSPRRQPLWFQNHKGIPIVEFSVRLFDMCNEMVESKYIDSLRHYLLICYSRL